MKAIIDTEAVFIPGAIIGIEHPLDNMPRNNRLSLNIETEKNPSNIIIIRKEKNRIFGMNFEHPNILNADLLKIGLNRLANHICFVALPSCLRKNRALQNEANKWLKKALEPSSWEAPDIKFHGLSFNSNAPYDAQFVSIFLKFLSDQTDSFMVPSAWKIGTPQWDVTPVMLKDWTKAMCWQIQWIKND